MNIDIDVFFNIQRRWINKYGYRINLHTNIEISLTKNIEISLTKICS